MPMTIFRKRCDVTMFDLHTSVQTDGRRRGLWVWFTDKSKARTEDNLDDFESGLQRLLERFPALKGKETDFRLSLTLFFPTFFHFAYSEQGALMTWEAVEKMHAALGKQLDFARRKGLLKQPPASEASL